MDEFNDDKEQARKQAQEKQLLANAQRAVDILGRVYNINSTRSDLIKKPPYFLGRYRKSPRELVPSDNNFHA